MIAVLAHELHLWRLHHLRSSPLVRTADRVETLLIVAVIGCGILLLPFSFLAVDVAYSSGVRASAIQHAQRHTVTATVTEVENPAAQSVTASWPLASGTRTTGVIPAATSDRVGTTRSIWIDSQGQSTNRPQPIQAAVGQGVLAGIGVATAILVVMSAAVVSIARVGDRRRLRSWEHEWRHSRLDARS